MIIPSEDLQALEDAIAGLEFVLKSKKSIRDYKKNDITDGEAFLLDSMLILELYGYDITVLFKNFGASNSEFEAKMMCRLLSMIMYEFISDVFEMLGGRFVQHTRALFVDFDYKQELKPFKNRLNNFKEKFEDDFKEVRNNVAAHRDSDPNKQLEIVNRIKLSTFIEAFDFFNPFTKDLNNYLFSLLERYEQTQKPKSH